MTKKPIFSTNAPQPSGAYSQALRSGNLIFVSGTLPLDPVTRQVAGDTIEEQTSCVLKNIAAILQSGGVSMADVVKTTVYLSDLSLFPRFNEVYSRAFPDPKPARTTVGSQLNGVLVEIDAIAFVE